MLGCGAGQELNIRSAGTPVGLAREQERRTALEAERQQVIQVEHEGEVDERHLLAELTTSATQCRAALAARTLEARRVLQALVQDRVEFVPFVHGHVRGYEFVGTGTYGGLLAGDTCPTNGGPNGRVEDWRGTP